MNLLTSATYLALLLSVIGLWVGWRVWASALALAVTLGYASGVLQGVAIVWIIAFAVVCVGFDRTRGARAAVCAIGLIVLALLLATHALPGFNNFLALDRVTLSEGAAPYTLYLNFDKTVVGILILALCYRAKLLTQSREWIRALRRGAPVIGVNVVVVAFGALALGYLTWQPKWTTLFWLWAPVNLFFVCLSEEAFFRGFLQARIAHAARRLQHGAALAILVSGVLFGLAHVAGGWTYVLLGTVAGIGYGVVYHRTRSVEMAMLAHFALNTTHFLLFTYPRTG